MWEERCVHWGASAGRPAKYPTMLWQAVLGRGLEYAVRIQWATVELCMPTGMGSKLEAHGYYKQLRYGEAFWRVCCVPTRSGQKERSVQ